MAFLTILKQDEQFTYRPEGADDAAIVCRVVPDDEIKAAKKRHTAKSWKHGQQVTELDWAAFGEDILDAAIVSWEGVCDSAGAPLPCERALKLALPESVKGDILRRAYGREFGGAEGEQRVGER